MDHNGGGNDSMSTPSASLCRAGCGFYGNQSFEGMCSKCYKDTVKRRQQNPATTQLAGRTSPAGSNSTYSTSSSTPSPVSGSDTLSLAATTSHSVETGSPTVATTTPSTSSSPNTSLSSSSSTSSITACTDKLTLDSTNTTPTSSPNAKDKVSSAADQVEATLEGAVAAVSSEEKEADTKAAKKPKKNRCHVCKKKVGLTGFECRCSGLFCSIHRYSDKHDCTFDYKEMAQHQIRKNNPIIVGEKIQKI